MAAASRGGAASTSPSGRRWPWGRTSKWGWCARGGLGRGCNGAGGGVAVVAGGGGVRYFFTRHIAINAGVDLHLGPAFYSGGDAACFQGQHVELWRSLSFLAGVTYAL